MRFGWSEWEATVDGAPFSEGRPRGDAQLVARDLERLRALTEARPGLRIVVTGGDLELTVENGRFGVHDVEVRRFLDEQRAELAQIERRPIALLEIRARLPPLDDERARALPRALGGDVSLDGAELTARLPSPTPMSADAFLRAVGRELFAALALAPIEGRVLLDGAELGTFDDALRLGDLGARARRSIA